MKEKLEKKIDEEINKVLKRNDFTLDEIKTMIDIKNGMEMKDMLKESFGHGMALSSEKGDE